MRQYLENILPDYFEQNDDCGHERSVLYCGKYIFSYKTCIGVLEKGALGTAFFLNKTKYSATTSALQNALREYAKKYVDIMRELPEDDPIFKIKLTTTEHQ